MENTATTDQGPRSWGRTARRTLASIRLRIVVGYIVLLAAALTLALVVTRQVQLARLDREIRRELAQEVEELRVLAAAGIDPRTGRPLGDDTRRILDTFLERNVPSESEAFYAVVDGEAYKRSFNAPPELFDDAGLVESWASVTEPTAATASTAVGEVRSLAVPLVQGESTIGGVFVVAFFPDVERAEIDQVIRVAAIAGVAVLAVSAALAWSLAGRVLRPVRKMTLTARQITGSDLSARIPVEGHDELAELGKTFNDMLTRLDDGLPRSVASSTTSPTSCVRRSRSPAATSRCSATTLPSEPTRSRS